MNTEFPQEACSRGCRGCTSRIVRNACRGSTSGLTYESTFTRLIRYSSVLPAKGWIKSISFAEKADNDVLAYYIDATRQAIENKANVATAREPACWCWAVGCMAEGA